MSVRVFGVSDDLIEVEGDIDVEFDLRNTDNGDILAFDNGIILRVAYTRDGIWTIRLLSSDTSAISINPAVGPDDRYSDIATIYDNITAVVHGTEWVQRV